METLGLALLGRGLSTCALTTPAIVSGSMPTARAWAKAASRSGPICAVLPASLREWQVAHLLVNSCRPRSTLPVWATPQPDPVSNAIPESASAAPRAAPRGMSVRLGTRRESYRRRLAPGEPGLAAAALLDRVASIRTSRLGGALDGSSRRHVEHCPHAWYRSHPARGRNADDGEGGGGCRRDRR